MNAGFAELSSEAGVSVSYKGSDPFSAVLDGGNEDPMRADTKLGSTRLARLTVARSIIEALAEAPAVGGYFDMGNEARLRIEDIDDSDTSDTTIAYVVKKKRAAGGD